MARRAQSGPMNLFPGLAIAPTLILAAIACVAMSQRSLLAAHRLPAWAAWSGALACAAILGAVAALGGGQAGLWGISAPVYSLAAPLRLVFLTVLLVGLSVTTITDLRERSLLAPVVMFPVVGALLIAAASIPWEGVSKPLHSSLGLIIVLSGMVVCGGLTYLFSLGGRLVAHLHGSEPDYDLVASMAEQSDLRFSDFWIPFAAVGLTALAGGVAWTSGNWLAAALGLIVAGGLAPAVRDPRRLSDARWWPRLGRGAGGRKQEEPAKTGQDAPSAEAFGTGDVWLMVLVGALLGPVYGLAAMFIGIVLNGLFTALPLFVYDIVTARKEDRYTPLVPWLAAGTLIVIFYAGLR